jgi:peptidoglycan/xylan/chitin deacetylase (PgdA/CDA1 family)
MRSMGDRHMKQLGLLLGALAVAGVARAAEPSAEARGEGSIALPGVPTLPITALDWRPPLPPTLVEHGPRDARRIALTFDACSSLAAGYESRITDILIRTHTPATVFLGGKWMLREQAHVRELAALPFLELGLHGYTHPHLTRVPDARILEELALDEQILFALTGRRADIYRPPFGEWDDRVLRVTASLGYLTVNFDAASGDADPRATAPKLIDWVPRIVKPGSIVVMHINGRGWHTAEALEELITTLRRKGYELVTVSELLGRRAVAAGMTRLEGAPAPALAAVLVPAIGMPNLVATTTVPVQALVSRASSSFERWPVTPALAPSCPPAPAAIVPDAVRLAAAASLACGCDDLPAAAACLPDAEPMPEALSALEELTRTQPPPLAVAATPTPVTSPPAPPAAEASSR